MAEEAIFPRVYISVLNWNGADKTIACVKSLQLLDYTNYQTIVVDNASTDDSVVRIKNAFPNLEIIVSDENLGYAGGNALALKYVQSINDDTGLFWILNNDAIVFNNTLTLLVDAYRQYGEAIYGSVNVEGGGDPANWQMNTAVWENNKFRRLRAVAYHKRYATTEPRSVDALSGSSLLIPLKVVGQHGFIDPSFFMYCEDVDYCFRMRRAGLQNIEVPESVIIHRSGTSHKSKRLDTLQPIITYYRARNKIVLWRDHFGTPGYIKALATQCFYVLGWLALTFRRGIVGPRSAYFTLMGIRDAILGRMGKVYAPEDYLGK